MEVQLSPELQHKLVRLAVEQGTDTQRLVRKAVERLVEHEEWFRSEVVVGLEQIERGQTMSHEDVGKRFEALLSSRRPAA